MGELRNCHVSLTTGQSSLYGEDFAGRFLADDPKSKHLSKCCQSVDVLKYRRQPQCLYIHTDWSCFLIHMLESEVSLELFLCRDPVRGLRFERYSMRAAATEVVVFGRGLADILDGK